MNKALASLCYDCKLVFASMPQYAKCANCGCQLKRRELSPKELQGMGKDGWKVGEKK